VYFKTEICINNLVPQISNYQPLSKTFLSLHTSHCIPIFVSPDMAAGNCKNSWLWLLVSSLQLQPFEFGGGEPNHCYVKMHSTTVLGTRYTVGHDSESLGGGELKADKKTSRNIYSQPFIKIRIVSKGVLWCTCPTSRLKPAHYTSKVLTSWRDKGILSQLLAAALVSRDHGVEIRRDEDEN